MANRDEILRELKVEEINHPLADNVTPQDVLVKFGILKYNQSNTFANPQDIPDLGYVQYLISLAGGLTKTVINKVGSDVDGLGNLDLSAEAIPTNAFYQVYVNGLSGYQALNYDETSMIMGGFGVSPGDDIKIIFI